MSETTTTAPTTNDQSHATPVEPRGEMIQAPASPPMIPGKDTSLLGGDQQQRVWTNLDLATDEGLSQAMMCMSAGCKKFEMHLNTVIKLHAVYLHDVEMVDPESGEVTNLKRIVLLDENGEGYECCSSGVLQCLRILLTAKGLGPWKPGLPVKLIQVSFTRKDNGQPGRIFKLLYCPEPKGQPAAARGRK